MYVNSHQKNLRKMSRAKKWAGSSRGLPAAEAPEVEEMLRAAEDEVLMGLHVGSHTMSSSSLDLDLARRFEALKTPSFRTSKAKQPIAPPHLSAPRSKRSETNDQSSSDVMTDDLMTRFAALKGPSSKPQPMTDPILYRDDSTDDEQNENNDGGDKVSKKEVEKVILWAMDAARLDPPVGHNKDNDVEKESDDEDEFVMVIEPEVEEKKKKRAKGKGSHGKWLSLFR